jgi:hypothetical protein
LQCCLLLENLNGEQDKFTFNNLILARDQVR